MNPAENVVEAAQSASAAGVGIWGWILFNLFVLVMLVLDLYVFHRKAHVIKLRESLAYAGFFVLLALAFCVGVYFWRGGQKATEFLTGYLIEESLSIDNLFVFLLVFNYFAVDRKHQYKILHWGIVGAVVLRLTFILAGVALIQRFEWVIYVFGVLLIYTAVKMLVQKEIAIAPEKNPVLRLIRKVIPVTPDYVGDRFFVKRAGAWFATPMFVVLVFVESADVVFAVDSIPAIFSVTRDPFIIYTSNVFAILGLRAIFFALAGLMPLFHYLKYGLAVILGFVGVKMLAQDYIHQYIPHSERILVTITLGVVAGSMAVAILASIFFPPKKVNNPQSD